MRPYDHPNCFCLLKLDFTKLKMIKWSQRGNRGRVKFLVGLKISSITWLWLISFYSTHVRLVNTWAHGLWWSPTTSLQWMHNCSRSQQAENQQQRSTFNSRYFSHEEIESFPWSVWYCSVAKGEFLGINVIDIRCSINTHMVNPWNTY